MGLRLAAIARPIASFACSESAAATDSARSSPAGHGVSCEQRLGEDGLGGGWRWDPVGDEGAPAGDWRGPGPGDIRDGLHAVGTSRVASASYKEHIFAPGLDRTVHRADRFGPRSSNGET